MEQFVNDYYKKIESVTVMSERSKIKAEYEAAFATLAGDQKQEVKAILAKRIDERMVKLAPLDEAIERFNEYLKQRDELIVGLAPSNFESFKYSDGIYIFGEKQSGKPLLVIVELENLNRQAHLLVSRFLEEIGRMRI